MWPQEQIQTNTADQASKIKRFSNKNIPNRYFRFHDAFPISLSGIELESGADGETVVATVEFRFTYYDIATTS